MSFGSINPAGYEGGDDGDIITFVSQVSENADSEEEIAGTLADTGVADS